MVDRSPTIELVIGYAPNAQSNYIKSVGAKFVPVKACIDTDCDEIHVNRDLLIDCGCPVVGSSHVLGAFASQASKRHLAQLIYPDLGLEGEVEVLSHDWGDRPKVYQAILGTRFLELGQLVLDPHGESYFTFHVHDTIMPDQSSE